MRSGCDDERNTRGGPGEVPREGFADAWRRRDPRAAAAMVQQREGLEATAGIEPAIRVLQTPALPLGYVASRCSSIVPGPGLVRERERQ